MCSGTAGAARQACKLPAYLAPRPQTPSTHCPVPPFEALERRGGATTRVPQCARALAGTYLGQRGRRGPQQRARQAGNEGQQRRQRRLCRPEAGVPAAEPHHEPATSTLAPAACSALGAMRTAGPSGMTSAGQAKSSCSRVKPRGKGMIPQQRQQARQHGLARIHARPGARERAAEGEQHLPERCVAAGVPVAQRAQDGGRRLAQRALQRRWRPAVTEVQLSQVRGHRGGRSLADDAHLRRYRPAATGWIFADDGGDPMHANTGPPHTLASV